MGWLRTIFLGDIGNRLDIQGTEDSIHQLREELRESRYGARSLEERVAQLERDNEQVELFVSVLLKRLRTKGVLTTGEIQEMARIVED